MFNKIFPVLMLTTIVFSQPVFSQQIQNPAETSDLVRKIADLGQEVDANKAKIADLTTTLKYKDEEITRLSSIISALNVANLSGASGMSAQDSKTGSSKNIVNVSNVQPYQPVITGKCADTIVYQAKQLAKAYDEITAVKTTQNKLGKVLDNFVFLAQNLSRQGKLQDAASVYEVLSRAEVKNQQIYLDLAQIYIKLGMDDEANKEYLKMNSLFPNLKGNENFSK